MNKTTVLLLLLLILFLSNLNAQYKLEDYMNKSNSSFENGILLGVGSFNQLDKPKIHMFTIFDDYDYYSKHSLNYDKGFNGTIGGFANCSIGNSMLMRFEFEFNGYISDKKNSLNLYSYQTVNQVTTLFFSIPISVIYRPELPSMKIPPNIKPYIGAGLNVNVRLAEWAEPAYDYYITDGNTAANYGYQIMLGTQYKRVFGELRYEHHLDPLTESCPLFSSTKFICGILF
jgi:hypothetical protein